MKRLCVLIAIGFSGYQAFAQQSDVNSIGPDSNNDPKYLEMKKHRAEIAENFAKQNSQAISMYYGYDELLRSFFIGNTIHADVPKSKTYSAKQDYVKAVNLWLSENKQYLKPEHQNAFIKE